MNRRRLDPLFLRFRERGDVAALGALFDRAAPQLMAIARHLAGDEATAEDALQETFRTAIERRDVWDARRPLLPWLVGILSIHVKRARARAEDVIADGGLEWSDERDPAEIVAGDECRAFIEEAIDRLPPTYAEPLRLSLLADQPPREIGAALGLSANAASVRLHRGLRLLRKLLPSGVALGGAVAPLGPGEVRGLAAVRRTVTQDAVAAISSGTARTATAGVASWKIGTVAVGAAAALMVAYVAADSRVERTRPDVIGRAHDADLVELASTEEVVGDSSRTVAVPVGTAPASIETTASAASVRVVTGRVVASETGSPIEGATVECLATPYGDRRPAQGWSPASASTGADGRFRLEIDAPPDARPGLRIHADGRGAMVGFVEEEETDHGDVPLARGARVTLRVLDASDRPVPGFRCSVRGGDTPLEMLHPRLNPELHLGRRTSDANGLYEPLDLPFGRYRILPDATFYGYDVLGPESFEVSEASPGDVVLRLRRPESAVSIQGTVRDELGRAVPDLELWVPLPEIGVDAGRTDTEGRFAFPIGRLGMTSGELRLPNDERRFEIVEPIDRIAVGEHVDVFVRRLMPVDLVIDVVDGENGAPITFDHVLVERFVQESGASTILHSARSLQGRAAPGTITLRAVAPGTYRLLVRPHGAGFSPVVNADLDVVEERRVRVEVPRSVTWEAQVTGADGNPVAGSEVRLCHDAWDARRGRVRGTRTIDELLEGSAHSTDMPFVSVIATTNSDGVATLKSPPDLEGAALHVVGPAHADASIQIGPAVPTGPVEIHVGGLGSLAGTVAPLDVALAWGPDADLEKRLRARAEDPEAEILSAMPEIIVTPLADGHSSKRAREVHIGRDGRFALDRIPADEPLAVDLCAGHGRWYGRKRVTEIPALSAGETRDLRLDLSAMGPASCEALVRVNGEPLALGEVHLWSGRNGAHADVLDGAVSIERMMPGAYRATVEFRSPYRYVKLSGERTITPGSNSISLDVETADVSLRLRDESGAPRAHRSLSIVPIDADERRFPRLRHRSDGDGRTVIKGVPYGRYEVLLWPDGLADGVSSLPEDIRATSLGSVEVSERRVSAEL
ncbi:MAG: sigma-70 family RNA polymerase sigma factor [Planctomycetota bacterium]